MNVLQLISEDSATSVKIEKGELVSYIVTNEELIHQKGTPGWRNSDTEMFPIIGPTDAANYTVNTPKGSCIQDQHGLLRELTYTLIHSSATTAVYQKIYKANTLVNNAKFPTKSPKELLSWPYNFTFTKKYNLTNTTLTITFEIEAEKGMPFMLGYHPAFKLNGMADKIGASTITDISIAQIMEGGSTAFPLLNTRELNLIKSEGQHINLQTKGFGNFMLWTEVPSMLCIEPITAYPYTEGELLSEKLFNHSTGFDSFEVLITPYL